MDTVLLKQLVNQGLSSYKIAKKLGLSQSYVYKRITKLGLKTDPYKYKGDCPNCTKRLVSGQKKYCSNQCQREYEFKLVEKNISTETSPRLLKKYLIKRDNRCSVCSMPAEWEFKPIVLILDHIDGHSENNELDNLRLICPNCDSQLSTFKGRNTGNGRHSRRQRYKEGKSY